MLILLFPLTGRQARDVQLCPRHDLRPHRMAFSDPVRHPPAGRAHRAQAESHLQDRLRQQVRILYLEALSPVLPSKQLISVYPRIYPVK